MKARTFFTGHTVLPEAEEDFVARLLENPPDPIKALEAQYEIALARLLERRLDHSDEHSQHLTRRITRHFLFNYYSGFMLFKFGPSYQDKAVGTARQRTIEDALQKLARSELAHQLMTEHFTAALEQRLHRVLREFLDAHKPFLHPRRAIQWAAVRILLADDWEKLGRYIQTLYQGVPFGLSGFHLLFKGTGIVQPQEFEVLMEYAHQWAHNCWWSDITDIVRILAVANLLPKQQKELFDFVRSLVDVEQYPYNEPEDDEQEPIARIERMGLSPALTGVFRVIGKVFERRLREGSRSSREYRPSREQYNLQTRHEEIAKMLSILARQSQEALIVLQESRLVEMAMESLLPIALNHLPALETLTRHIGRDRRARLSDDNLETLRESNQLLDKGPAEFLLDFIREDADSCPWATQILENVPGLTEGADRRIATIVRDETSPAVLSALIQMYLGLRERGRRSPQELEGALFTRLMDLLFDPEIRPRSEWISFLATGSSGSPLQEVMERINGILSKGESSLPSSRSLEVLRAIAYWAEQIPQPDAVTLAACWLVDPEDSIEDKSTLAERVQEAIRLLRRPTDWFTQQTAAHILYATAAKRPGVWQILARSLRTLQYPELALPLLEKLLDVTAAEDWYYSQKIYTEAFKSVAALKPLTPQAILLLKGSLSAIQSSETRLYLVLTPAFVYNEILPLLVHEVSPEAIPILIKVIEKTHIRGEASYSPDGLMLLCALQSLANVPNLSPPQQRVIWRLYRTSRDALVKSLSLLILGRQRPPREETIRVLMHILRKGPFFAVLLKTILCQGIAVNMIGALLRQQRGDILVKKYQRDMEKALLSVASLPRYGMESHLAVYASTWGTKAMAQMMGVTSEEVGQEKVWSSSPWIAHPAAIAYQTLQDLRAEKALSSLR